MPEPFDYAHIAQEAARSAVERQMEEQFRSLFAEGSGATCKIILGDDGAVRIIIDYPAGGACG